MANDSKSRKNKNVNFRMSEKSEKVLVKNRVSSAHRVEEDGFEVTIHKKHSNCSSKNG
jgi:hypothetical protein